MSSIKKLTKEYKVKELKNHYTIEGSFDGEWMNLKAPMMQKVIFGVQIPKPTAYRIYTNYTENDVAISCLRTWVFGEVETNPNRFNVKNFLSS